MRVHGSPASRDDLIGAVLAYGCRWGPVFLLVLVTNTFVATLAWMIVGSLME